MPLLLTICFGATVAIQVWESWGRVHVEFTLFDVRVSPLCRLQTGDLNAKSLFNSWSALFGASCFGKPPLGSGTSCLNVISHV